MQFSLFGSILTFGAMFGAITSGPIADSLGRKWVYINFILFQFGDRLENFLAGGKGINLFHQWR